MQLFGSVCPPAFYHVSRDLGVLKQIVAELAEIGDEEFDRKSVGEMLDAQGVHIIDRHMAEHAADLYLTFPGLTVYPSNMQLREIVAAIRRSSLMTGERKRFKHLRRVLSEAKRAVPSDLSPLERKRVLSEVQDRALFAAYTRMYGLNGNFEEMRRVSHQAVKNTQGFIDQLLETYLPINHRKQLEFAACVRAARDFPTLVELAGHCSNRGVISKRIAHEARVIAVLSQIEFEYLTGAYNPERVDAIREDLISLFENEVFDKSESRRLVVVAELDPQNDYRVRRDANGNPALAVYDETQPEAHQMTTSTRLVLLLDVRVVRRGGVSVPVYFDTRRKDKIFTKLFRMLWREPEHITDHSGLEMVFFTNDMEVEVAANRLREVIVTVPGQVWAQKSNAFRAGAVDPNNPHSSVDRRAEKYNFRWGGITHELQMLDLATYVDSLVSRNRIAHVIYKYLTLVDNTFPFLWPKELYGKDWMAAEFRDLLWQYQVGRMWTGKDENPCDCHGAKDS